MPLLGEHLELLDIGYAVLGVKHHDLCAGHVFEALQGGLSGVAGGGHQDADRLFLTVFRHGCCQQVGQHLQRHILESTGGAVPELKDVGFAVELPYRSHLRAVKLAAAIGLLGKAADFILGKAVKEQLEDRCCTGLIVHFQQPMKVRQLGEGLRQEQAAVTTEALFNGLSRGVVQRMISRTHIIHVFTTLFIVLA